ncbi:NAD(P)-dependent oxidoreductase [Bacillus sp. BGMRC 2118]|nr:NAD(P)-dependent oxidoreductase [Bacillus sp. BGMRC 2118]
MKYRLVALVILNKFISTETSFIHIKNKEAIQTSPWSIRNGTMVRKGDDYLEDVLVLGSMSFVGFHLVKRLLEDGITVYSVEINDEKRDEIKEEKMLEIGRNANFISLDSQEAFDIEDKLQAIFICYDTEEIVEEGYVESFSDILQDIIHECQSRGTRLVFISSLEAIDHDVDIVTEETGYKPRNKTGELCAKWEKVIVNAYERRKFSYVILRCPTIYGPWQPNHFSYQYALEAIERKMQVKILEDSYIEDILYIDDVIEAIIRTQTITEEKEIIHITSGRSGEWSKGLELIEPDYHLQKKAPYATLSTKKARELLSFKPMVNIEDGIEYQRTHLKTKLNPDY